MTFSPWMSRCQSVAIEEKSSALTGLFGDLARTARRVSEERRRQRWCCGGGVFGAKVGKAGEVGGGCGGAVWRGPLRPLNWHVQARGFGRGAVALIRQ